MQTRRTRQFYIALASVGGLSILFLCWLALFGKSFAAVHFNGTTDVVFSIMALAAGSFLAFSFVPYFRGDRRWYAISALLTVVFFVGAVMLWQVPLSEGVIG